MQTKDHPTMQTSIHAVVTMPRVSSLVAAMLLAAAGCNDSDADDDSGAAGAAGTSFQCSEATAGWEQCVDGQVQYCHIVAGMQPHFHWGTDCQSLGYECLELSQSEAACLDQDSTCTVGEFRCQDNTAYNCVDHEGYGHFTVVPCGTSAACHEHDGEAHCVHAETTFTPQDACDAMTADEVEETAVVAEFSAVFAEDYHADLGIRVHVTLPDDQPSYLHFAVFSAGQFAVFLDQPAVFDGILHRDQTDVTVSGGSAVELCSIDAPEHWHANLGWDGDGTEGTTPVPYVIRFQAVAGGAEVSFAVFQIAVAE